MQATTLQVRKAIRDAADQLGINLTNRQTFTDRGFSNQLPADQRYIAIERPWNADAWKLCDTAEALLSAQGYNNQVTCVGSWIRARCKFVTGA